MRPRLSQDLASLALIVAAALAGHLLLAPLFAPLRATMGGYRAPPPPPRQVDPAMRAMLIGEPFDRIVGPFHASSLESGFSWRGDFRGHTAWGPDGLRAIIPTAKIHRSIQAGGRLRSVRLDLARGDPAGSWSLAHEGIPVSLTLPLEPGESRVSGPLELQLPGVTPEELHGGWLVVVMELETENGGPGWTYAHMDPELARGVALRAAALRDQRP